MKTIATILMLFFGVVKFSAQINNDLQSDPQRVLEEVFKAAKSGDFSNLHKLCPPDKSNDGDTQRFICDVATSSAQTKKEFIAYFKDAYITGDVVRSKSLAGGEIAEIPFWFNHPSGGNRCNETMKLIKIDDKWYLLSF